MEVGKDVGVTSTVLKTAVVTEIYKLPVVSSQIPTGLEIPEVRGVIPLKYGPQVSTVPKAVFTTPVVFTIRMAQLLLSAM
jgi:hypothetical protein